jgi:hypothetical protein
MPRTQASIDKIRSELAWVNEETDPNRCGCRNVLCCERGRAQTGRMQFSSNNQTVDIPVGILLRVMLGWCGSKRPGAMTAK